MNFTETDEQQALRAAAAELGRKYGYAFYTKQAREGGRLTELWQEAGKLGFLGVNLYDAGDDMAAGEAANMAKYAAAEAGVRTVDQAIQTLGGSSMTREFGLAAMLANVRTTRIAPVSREMILNFVAQYSLGLPKSY